MRKKSHPPRFIAPKQGARSLSVPYAAIRQPSSSRRIVQGSFATMTAIAALMALQRPSLAGPTGGTVVEGSAGISQVGATTNINQSSSKAIINWQGFSIAPQETVNFNQPSSSAVTLNRVIGNEQSVISGALNANGQVFIVNSAGVLFTKSSQVNVGGLVASTLDISNANFIAGNYTFSGSSAASVVNLGKIHAHDGGYVALLGKTVSNEGVITATLGTVAMASGDKITLNFEGNSLLDVTIDEGTLNALVENKAAIKADGGRVILTAKAADAVLSAQVNNSGVIQARTMAALKGGSDATTTAHVGSIKLLASGGTVNVAGKLDASAPKGGNGGKIETSGNKVTIADNAIITTKAANGTNGTWLIDPTDFTIFAGTGNQTSSGIGATTLLNELANGNVVIVTSSSGADLGDINVNAVLNWSSTSATPSANSLTLAAANNINVNAPVTWSAGTLTLNAGANIYVNNVMTASGTASFAANYGHVIDASGNSTAAVTGAGLNTDGYTPYGLYTLQSAHISSYSSPPSSFVGKINFAGSGAVTLNGQAYTVITCSSACETVLPTISPTGYYVLGNDLSVNWNKLTTPIGTDAQPLTGAFNGFGHMINLGIQSDGLGLFGTIGATGVVTNLYANSVNLGPNPNNNGANTTDPTVNLAAFGLLADVNKGTILNSFAIGSVTAQNGSTPNATVADVGGFVGDNYGLIANSYAAVLVTGTLNIGGFVGANEASGAIYTSASRFSNGSSVQGTVSSIAYAGGFAGVNSGLISQSYTRTGVDLSGDALTSNSLAGGFVGKNTSTGTIDQSYVYYGTIDGTAQIYGVHTAGFVGDNAGAITNSYSTALSSGFTQPWDSAFAYINSGTISTSYAIANGSTSTTKQSFGFVAVNNGGTTTDDYWYAPQYNPSTPAPLDNSTATQLTKDQSSVFANYVGFDPTIWGATTHGESPILVQLSVLVSPISANSNPSYGSSASDTFSTLAIAGLQGIDSSIYSTAAPASQFALITPPSGFIDAGSYSATSVVTSAVYTNIKGGLTIAPATLTLANGVVADKTYDGATVGAVNNGLPQGGLVGLVGSQTLDITYQSAAFSDKNAGQGKTATVAFTVTDGANGGKAANYIVSDTATATINPKTISASFSAADKIYDGSAQATATTQLSGVVSGDSVAVSYASSLFSDKNAGQNKTVTLSGLTLTGNDNSNYVLQAASVQSTATILPRSLDLYGTETVANSTSFSATGLYAKNAVPGDVVSLTGTATIAGTTAGVQAITSVSSATVNNPNYTLVGASGSVLVGTANLAVDKIVYGTVSITSSGSATTVTESTDKAIIDWLRFSIGSNESVTFVQPSSTSIVLNVVTGNERSVIDGALNANGRVFLVNSNGILFSGSSQVNVGALVATTLSIDNGNFENGVYQFATYGGAGSITEMGQITVANNGFAAFASGAGVTYSGSLSAPGGAAVLAAANNMTLTLDSATPGLTRYALGGLSGVASVGGTLNVSASSGNGGTIETAGDTVALANSLAMDTGVNGTWSYSQNGDISIGPNGAFSGQSVGTNLATRNLSLNSYQGSVSVNDAVTWSSDERLTLTAGANININNAITATGDHAGLTLAYGGYSEMGAVTAGSNYLINNLTIGKDLSITVGPASVTLTGANAGLSINGQAYTLIQSLAQLAALPSSPVLDQNGNPVFDPNTGNPESAVTGFYALGQDLVGTQTYSGPLIATFSGTLAGLGHKISNLTINDTAGTGGNGLIGSIGTVTYDYSNFPPQISVTGAGAVRDLGLTNLVLTGDGGGLAGQSNIGSTISNVYVKGSISGGTDVTSFHGPDGGLVGANSGVIDNAHVDIAITIPGAGNDIGGLAGSNGSTGLIKNSSAKGSIYVGGYAFADGGGVGSGSIGGLVGSNGGNIDNSHANVDIIANNSYWIGGLVGLNLNANDTSTSANITNSSAIGSISSEWLSTLFNGSGIGGLVGDNAGGAISNSSSTVSVSVKATNSNENGWATINDVGGLVGTNETSFGGNTAGSVVNSSYNGTITATGAVSSIGGGVGNNSSGTVSGIQTSGSINTSQGASTLSGPSTVGGLVGSNGGSLSNSSTSTTVTGTFSVGGAVGSNGGTIANVSATGSVTGTGNVGGFAGENGGSITNSKASGNVIGKTNVGGFAGTNFSTDPNAPSVISGSTATGNVNGVTSVGGLVGFNGGNVISSLAYGNVQGVTNVGGLVGTNGGLDQFGNRFDAVVDSSSAFGTVTGVTDVGALIGLNNNGGAGNAVVTNSSAFGAALVGGRDTNALIGSDLGSSTNNTYVNLPAQSAAAQAQIVDAAARAGTVIATTNTELAAESPPSANISAAGAKAVYSAAAPKIEDNISIESPPPPPAAAPSAERHSRREAANTTSNSHHASHKEGGGGGGAGFGARIRSIEIDGQHFDLERKSSDAPAPAEAQ
ncbi:filamentous hemagglutinin N-terminal domain-containing protein [Methylocapsa polymorpha]|uniref:Filamentous hemagglutinin N-terminal domain-containing protein n=1 Tax=Methylocapsa polymorpha TaxID=3080828 RepID=A0ABZ0HRN7_9HYPH|nr:filamentous hemagglutinin N-terminal domain-containing protein [Methylocapsa sp. RX1]